MLLPFKADFGGTETSSNRPGWRLGTPCSVGGRAKGLGLAVGGGRGLDPEVVGF
jgi:hypothetical protein